MADRALTVVVPTFNGARFLAATLDSLADQTEQPDVIVVDDGSSDESADIAEAHRVGARVVRQTNRGVAASRNRGLAVAATRYVAFMDQDDLWHQGRTKLLLSLAHDTDAMAVATAEQVFALASDRAAMADAGDPRADWPSHWIEEDGEGELVRGALEVEEDRVEEIPLATLMQGPAFVTTAVMYDREAAITAGGCAPFARAADDHVLNLNVARLFGPIVRIDRRALFYRIHPEATTNSSPMVMPLLTLQLALRHGGVMPREAAMGPNLEHLVALLATEAGLSRSERLALLRLSVPPSQHRRWVQRWVKGSARRALRR